MNYYVVVEGITEKIVYKEWVPLANSALQYVETIDSIQDNNFYIISGNGYPGYFDVISAAIDDVNANQNIHRLVIAIDSEDMDADDKRKEICDYVDLIDSSIDYKVIIQHFCFETWALGNRKIFKNNPHNQTLLEYIKHFDVAKNDPELLPELPEEELNRAQFANKYLRLLINEKNPKLSYTKSNPKLIAHHKYFQNINKRYEETNHIPNFKSFLDAFV